MMRPPRVGDERHLAARRSSCSVAPTASFALLPATTGPGPLNEQIALELGDSSDNATVILPAAQVRSTPPSARQWTRTCIPAMLLDRGADVHRVSPQPIELGDDEHVFPIQSINQFAETLAFHCRRGSRNSFRDHSALLEGKSRGLNFEDLIFIRLLGRADTAICKHARHRPPVSK
jgi:hypothetical protein